MISTPDLLIDGHALLDTQLLYARYVAAPLEVEQVPRMMFGPPGAMLVSSWIAAGQDRRAYERAVREAAPRWREQTAARVVVTSATTWCRAQGRWLEFGHDKVLAYTLTGDTVIAEFRDSAPLALTGPPAWAHAVLFAHFAYPVGGMARAAWLTAIRDSSSAHGASETSVTRPSNA